MAFCCGLLLCPSVMAFWFGGLLIEGGLLVESGLLLWPSGMAFWCGAFWCCGLLVERVGPPPEDHTRRLPSIRRPPNQKAIIEGHNRRPQQKATPTPHPAPPPAGTPWGDPPKLPPWMWAWTSIPLDRSP